MTNAKTVPKRNERRREAVVITASNLQPYNLVSWARKTERKKPNNDKVRAKSQNNAHLKKQRQNGESKKA